MHYVKQFNINGVATKQVACIELQGVPNATTEGAVGVLGIDVLSPTHEVYRCVAVNGSVYKWELLSAGMSIMSATSTGEGAATKSFPYSNLLIPSNYLIKVGDLILDSEGYLYQITAIGTEACDTMYCGTQIGGIANGDKNCTLVVRDGKLQLVTESGNVVSSVDYFIPDNETVYRNPGSGKGKIIGVKTINDELLRFFVGTQDDYKALTEEQKQGLFAIPTDDTTLDDLISGKFVVGKAKQADNATILAPAPRKLYMYFSDDGKLEFGKSYSWKFPQNVLERDFPCGTYVASMSYKVDAATGTTHHAGLVEIYYEYNTTGNILYIWSFDIDSFRIGFTMRNDGYATLSIPEWTGDSVTKPRSLEITLKRIA